MVSLTSLSFAHILLIFFWHKPFILIVTVSKRLDDWLGVRVSEYDSAYWPLVFVQCGVLCFERKMDSLILNVRLLQERKQALCFLLKEDF